VKKLEYSADKLQKQCLKKDSDKKKDIKLDRSVDIESSSKDYFEIRRSHRKNTLSGQKRTKQMSSQDGSPERGRFTKFIFRCSIQTTKCFK
jgi:hypothetical protein